MLPFDLVSFPVFTALQYFILAKGVRVGGQREWDLHAIWLLHCSITTFNFITEFLNILYYSAAAFTYHLNLLKSLPQQQQQLLPLLLWSPSMFYKNTHSHIEYTSVLPCHSYLRQSPSTMYRRIFFIPYKSFIIPSWILLLLLSDFFLFSSLKRFVELWFGFQYDFDFPPRRM